MGSVKVDTANLNTGYREFEKFNFSDKRCISEMIVSRIDNDVAFRCKIDHSPNPFFASDTQPFSELMMCMYMDLENLVSNSDMSKIELTIIDNLYLGYDFADIDELFLGQQYGLSESMFEDIVDKIKEANDKHRYECYEKNGIELFYKTCSRCDEEKLVSKFGKDIRLKDGLKSYCKSCDK